MSLENGKSIGAFTLKEKVFAQFTYNMGVMIAAYGLYLNNKSLGIGYLIGAYMGIALLIRYTICPRCPHLHVANDCVNLPAPIMKKIVSPNRKGPLNVFEKSLFIIVLYGTFILPIYWLSSNMIILIAFIVFYGGHLISLRIHFCENCANTSCIQNRSRQNLLIENKEKRCWYASASASAPERPLK
jgi:hypothetical protein